MKEFGRPQTGALFAVVLVVSAVGMLAAPLIAAVFAPGSVDEPEKFGLITQMLRITFPYLLFISLMALSASVLNSFGRFALPAVTPVLHNLTMIAAMLWLAPHFEVPAVALAWGVLAAGILQLLVLWPALGRLGLRPTLKPGFHHPDVRRVARLMLPTLFSSSVAQLNLLVGTVFASLLVTGSQTWLYLSDRRSNSAGLFGVAIGTVTCRTARATPQTMLGILAAATGGCALRLWSVAAGTGCAARRTTDRWLQGRKINAHDTAWPRSA